MTKEKTTKDKVEGKIKEQPAPKEEPAQKAPMDISKLLEAGKEFMPGLVEMVKPKKKDPSAMCEFTIKGSDDFVVRCLGLILG